MPVELNHTIVNARDAAKSAEYVAELLGLGPTKRFGPFVEITTANGVDLAFIDSGDDFEIQQQHYAFLVSDEEFDATYGKIVERGLDHWADPHKHQPGEINHHYGGRGVYFEDLDGHFLEIITTPYGTAMP
jgi:catechol 2,3-dioxygenase-like lactoylglutathione lyase family enzyme